MDRVERNPMANGFDHHALHIVLSVQLFQPTEHDRMMGDNDVTAFLYRLIDNFFRTIQRDECLCNLIVRMANNQTGIIVRLLVGQRSNLLQISCQFFYLHLLYYFFRYHSVSRLPSAIKSAPYCSTCRRNSFLNALIFTQSVIKYTMSIKPITVITNKATGIVINSYVHAIIRP